MLPYPYPDPGAIISIGPLVAGETETFAFDFSTPTQNGADAIVAVAVTFPSASGLVQQGAAHTASGVTVQFSGGTAGASYLVEIKATTQAGQVLEILANLPVVAY